MTSPGAMDSNGLNSNGLNSHREVDNREVDNREVEIESQPAPTVPRSIGGVEAHGGSRDWGSAQSAFVPMSSRMGRGQ